MRIKVIGSVIILALIVLAFSLYILDDIEQKECITSFTIDDSSINQEKNEMFLNSDYFSDIITVDATNLEDTMVIGRYKQFAFDKQSPWEIIELLLKSHSVTTYWHLRSEICLVEEKDTADIYTADFYASHDYCTNECITENYEFSMEIDKNDGTITISPGQ